MGEILFYQSRLIKGMGQANVIINIIQKHGAGIANIYIIFEHFNKKPELFLERYSLIINENYRDNFLKYFINAAESEIFTKVISQYFEQNPRTLDVYEGCELQDSSDSFLYPINYKYPEILIDLLKLVNDDEQKLIDLISKFVRHSVPLKAKK